MHVAFTPLALLVQSARLQRWATLLVSMLIKCDTRLGRWAAWRLDHSRMFKMVATVRDSMQVGPQTLDL